MTRVRQTGVAETIVPTRMRIFRAGSVPIRKCWVSCRMPEIQLRLHITWIYSRALVSSWVLRNTRSQQVRRKSSSPKLLVLNTALMSALKPLSLEEALGKPEHWGRLVETAVGNFLANTIKGKDLVLNYWAGRNREVDFILSRVRTPSLLKSKAVAEKQLCPEWRPFQKNSKLKGVCLSESRAYPLNNFF